MWGFCLNCLVLKKVDYKMNLYATVNNLHKKRSASKKI